MAVKQFKNNRRKMIKERTEKGSLSRMLDTFNNKIYDLENGDFDESIDNKNHPYWMDDDVGFDIPEPDEKTAYDVCDDEDEDFEESFNIDEMAKPHTWGVTYRDKYNKTKQHVIDAPDAYDAKMKARRELGVNFSDIIDAEMIENLEEDTNSQNYMTVGKLLPKLVQTQNFVLVSAQNEADILFKGKVQGSVDNSVSNINVYYFGAWDDKTIAFYVDENDVKN